MAGLELAILPLLLTPVCSVDGGTVDFEIRTGRPPEGNQYLLGYSITDDSGNPVAEEARFTRNSTEYFTTPPLPNGAFNINVYNHAGDSISRSFTVNCAVSGGGEPEPVYGCMNPMATNYNPLATEDTDPTSCIFPEPEPEPDPSPEPASLPWRSAWQPLSVRVLATGNPLPAFLSAELLTGSPLALLTNVRATVGPDGYATFNLGAYMRTQLGAVLPSGQRRLDLNSVGALTEDLYSPYELRTGGTLHEAGIALNSAVPDEQVPTILTPFAVLPLWPGFEYEVSRRTSSGTLEPVAPAATGLPRFVLPCPKNALPVRWLSAEGGYGYWVFAGRPEYSDEIGDGQLYREAQTGERRYASRGESLLRIQASSGQFSNIDLLHGLRTLRRSPQAWYQPEPDGPWVPIVLEAGTFPAYRAGVHRYEFTISFTVAQPVTVQGQ